VSNGPLTGRREVAVMDLARESEMRTLAFSFSFSFSLCLLESGLHTLCRDINVREGK